MKKVILYEVKEKEITVSDNQDYIRSCVRSAPEKVVIGSDVEEAVISYEETALPIKRLSKMVNWKEMFHGSHSIEPIYENNYYALTESAEKLMSIVGLYSGTYDLMKEKQATEDTLDKANKKLDELKSTKFFGRLKLLFVGIK